MNNSFLFFYFISTSRNLLLKSFAENAVFCVESNCNSGEQTRGLGEKRHLFTLESKEIAPLFKFVILIFYMSFFVEVTAT